MKQCDNARHIRRIRSEYPEAYNSMNWLSPGAAQAAEQTRQDLIGQIFDRPGEAAGWEFAATKLFTHGISPGCQLCGQGLWSCLFINGVCNAGCFYCPSAQNDNGPPITSSVEFARAQDYADYVNRFNIRGVGFSGGEPLLALDRVTDYLTALNHTAEKPIHTWMYTNGILATDDRIRALKDAGLKEIRFDLSANDYTLCGLEKAVGTIPIVTVEIPAIPEDIQRTKQLIRDLHLAGADYLNLHQIRCTPFNRPKLQQRGYTFLHGPGVAVLDTELTALELIRHALDQDIRLPINYCSFTYRNQFQKAGARHRNAQLVKQAWEGITGTGYIRTLTLKGDPDRISRVQHRFQEAGENQADWQISPKGDRLAFPAELGHLVDFEGLNLNIKYSATALRTEASNRYPSFDIQLNDNKKVVVERDNRHAGVRLQGDEIQAFFDAFLVRDEQASAPFTGNGLPGTLASEISRFETFSQGLAPYV